MVLALDLKPFPLRQKAKVPRAMWKVPRVWSAPLCSLSPCLVLPEPILPPLLSSAVVWPRHRPGTGGAGSNPQLATSWPC